MTKQHVKWVSLSYTVIGLFIFIINGYILHKEWIKRKSKKIKFTNKYLQIFSLTSMISGVLYGFFFFVTHFNGLCHFASSIRISCLSFQGLFMGFYQLSRLYYCFSQTKVYSNKGYPNLLFSIMYIIGILLLLTGILSGWVGYIIIRKCGINNKFEYRY